MAGHVGGYTGVQVASLLALRRLGVRPSWRRLAGGVLFSAITHAFLDRRWPVRWVLAKTGSPGFAQSNLIPALTLAEPGPGGVMRTIPAPLPIHGPYLADQALHHVCLAISAWIIVGGL